MGTPTPITITGTIRNGETTVAGRLVFASSTLVRDNSSDDVMLPFEIVVDVPADGEFSQAVPATIDPGFSPSGWTIEVRPHFPHWVTPFSVSIPYNASGGTLDFSELAPVPPDGDGDLYALLNHTHTIEQVNDLQVQLDSKLDVPIEPYITAEDISGLISAEAVAEGYLPKTSPVVTDSTFTVVRSDGGEARWRATGGALDIDLVGDVIESSFSGAGFTGTQTGLRRLRSGSGNTLAGLTEFGSTPYLAEQSIDATTGVANLGAKNGAANLGISGFVDVDGPPTSGTWAVNNLVLTRTGTYRCTVAGTPGTWVGGNVTGAFTPPDHGLVGWTFDPASVFGATILPAAGTMKVAKVKATSRVVTNILFHLTLGGSALTNCFAALYNEAGALLGAGAISDNQATAWQSGGLKTCVLSTPQAVDIGATYRVAWWWNGSTAPTFSRGSASGSTIINVGQTAGTARYATADTGRTDAASVPANLGSLAGDSIAWWVGLS